MVKEIYAFVPAKSKVYPTARILLPQSGNGPLKEFLSWCVIEVSGVGVGHEARHTGH
jgi:hypothetical protein